MPNSTLRYAAKEAYKLALYRGIYTSSHCGAVCHVEFGQRVVSVTDPDGVSHNVMIRKNWSN